MKTLNYFLVIVCIFTLSCATVNNAGNKITTERTDKYLYKSIDGSTFRTNVYAGYDPATSRASWPYYKVYCNNQLAYVIYKMNNLSYLRTVEYINKKFYVLIEGKLYLLNINDILPEDIAIPEFDKIVFEKTGFKTLKEYNQHLEQQKQLDQQAKIREEQERNRENTRRIENINEMQELKQRNIILSTQHATNDFNNYSTSYAIPHLNLQQLLISISSGLLRQVFASNLPLPLSIELNKQIEDWQYISKQQFENAVYILTYMETVDKLQRRSRY